MGQQGEKQVKWYEDDPKVDDVPQEDRHIPARHDFSDFDAGAAAAQDFHAKDFAAPEPERPEDSAKTPPPFPLDGIDLLTPPGMVGDVAAWIDSQCRYPRRRLAVASAIVTVGNIGGMTHYDTRDGVTANMLAFCVAASACHAKGHPILMFDGTTKPVEDIVVGDKLMGPDGKERNVLSLARGRQEMVKITPIKGEGFTVNLDHIMNLQMTGDDFRVNMTVRDWISSSHRVKRLFKLRKSFFDKPDSEYAVSPYVLGVMLGDGCLVGKVMVTSQDQVIHDEVTSEFIKWQGIETRHHQVRGNKSWSTIYSMGKIGKADRPLINEFKRLGLWGCGAGEKFIPQEYKTGSIAQRLELLAGIMDTDGHNSVGGYEYVSKSERLANDVVYIARSVGLAATIRAVKKYAQTGSGGGYFRVFISGDCTIVPVRLPHKKTRARKMNKNPLLFGFSYEVLPVDDYYGFALDGDHLYMDGLFWVHHNTGKEAVQQAMADLHRAAGLNYAVQGGIKSEQEITRNLIEHQAAFYIIDEIGIFLNKVRNAQKRGGASYLEGVFGLIMSAYSKANSRLLLNGDTRRELRKIYQAQAAAANKRAEEEGTDTQDVSAAIRMLEMIDNGLERPFLSLVGYTTPSTFDSVMDGEAATQGFIGRSIIVSERDINPEARTGFVKRELPLGLSMRVAQLFPPCLSEETRGKGRIEWSGDQRPVKTDAEADAMLLQITHWLHRYADDMGEDTGEASVAMVRRSFEMIAKISFILAIPDGVRTAEHVRWAFAYVRQELDAKISLVFANDRGRDRPEDAMAARLMGYLDAEKGVSVSVLANRMKAPPETIKPLLARMEGAGMVRKMQGRKYRGKVIEVWMAAQK